MIYENFSDSELALYASGVFNNEDMELIQFSKTKLATTGLGIGLAGVAGYIKAKKEIEKREKELGEPLSKAEKQDIYLKYVGGASALGGLLGFTGGKLAEDSGIINKINKGLNKGDQKIQSLSDAYWKMNRAKGKLKNRFLKGISFEDQNLFKKQDDELVALGEAAKNKPISEMSPAELIGMQARRDRIFAIGTAREAMLTGAGALILSQIVKPIWNDMKEKQKKRISQEQLFEIASHLKKQGKSEEEIKNILEELTKG